MVHKQTQHIQTDSGHICRIFTVCQSILRHVIEVQYSIVKCRIAAWRYVNMYVIVHIKRVIYAQLHTCLHPYRMYLHAAILHFCMVCSTVCNAWRWNCYNVEE